MSRNVPLKKPSKLQRNLESNSLKNKPLPPQRWLCTSAPALLGFCKLVPVCWMFVSCVILQSNILHIQEWYSGDCSGKACDHIWLGRSVWVLLAITRHGDFWKFGINEGGLLADVCEAKWLNVQSKQRQKCSWQDFSYDVVRRKTDKNLHRGSSPLSTKARKDAKSRDWCFSSTHLSHIFKVVVSFLQGPGSVEGFPHPRVFAEERFTVVLDPVYHLDEAQRIEAHPSRCIF